MPFDPSSFILEALSKISDVLNLGNVLLISDSYSDDVCFDKYDRDYAHADISYVASVNYPRELPLMPFGISEGDNKYPAYGFVFEFRGDVSKILRLIDSRENPINYSSYDHLDRVKHGHFMAPVITYAHPSDDFIIYEEDVRDFLKLARERGIRIRLHRFPVLTLAFIIDYNASVDVDDTSRYVVSFYIDKLYSVQESASVDSVVYVDTKEEDLCFSAKELAELIASKFRSRRVISLIR